MRQLSRSRTILTSIGGRGAQVFTRERFLGQFAHLSCGKSLHRALPRPRCLLAKLVGRSRIPSALGASRGARVSTLPPLLERRTRCRRRGTVTAVACPHLSSSISLNGGRELRSLAYAPFGAARGRVLRTCGPALFMADARLACQALEALPPAFPLRLCRGEGQGEVGRAAKRPGRRDCAARVCA